MESLNLIELWPNDNKQTGCTFVDNFCLSPHQIKSTWEQISDRATRTNFLNENNELTIHIEWMDSLLLFSHLYSAYDSLGSIQLHQMRWVEDNIASILRNLMNGPLTVGARNWIRARWDSRPLHSASWPRPKTRATIVNRAPYWPIDRLCDQISCITNQLAPIFKLSTLFCPSITASHFTPLYRIIFNSAEFTPKLAD